MKPDQWPQSRWTPQRRRALTRKLASASYGTKRAFLNAHGPRAARGLVVDARVSFLWQFCQRLLMELAHPVTGNTVNK